MTEHLPRLAYSTAEAAEMLGVSRAWLYALMKDGTMPSVKLGRRRLIRADDLTALLSTFAEPEWISRRTRARDGDGAPQV